MLGAFALRSKTRPAIGPTDGAVDGLVGAARLRGHQV